eukprot:451823_1
MGLSQYLSNFISNGYETLEFIKEIDKNEELIEIGVEKLGHQKKLRAEIKRLNNEQTNDLEEGITGPANIVLTTSVIMDELGNEHIPELTLTNGYGSNGTNLTELEKRFDDEIASGSSSVKFVRNKSTSPESNINDRDMSIMQNILNDMADFDESVQL